MSRDCWCGNSKVRRRRWWCMLLLVAPLAACCVFFFFWDWLTSTYRRKSLAPHYDVIASDGFRLLFGVPAHWVPNMSCVFFQDDEPRPSKSSLRHLGWKSLPLGILLCRRDPTCLRSRRIDQRDSDYSTKCDRRHRSRLWSLLNKSLVHTSTWDGSSQYSYSTISISAHKKAKTSIVQRQLNQLINTSNIIMKLYLPTTIATLMLLGVPSSSTAAK